jgi:outer membrane protein TolC
MAAALAFVVGASALAEGAKALSVEEAVASGLASDPGLLSAAMDARASLARSAEARFRMLPSLALSTGYTKLSAEPSPSASATGDSVVDGVVNALMTDLTDTPTVSKDIRLDLQYPLFAGFRTKEAAQIAKLQSLGKEAAAELARRALTFDLRKAYWEATRATANVEALAKALELETVKRDETAMLAAQGMASEADRLDEEARYDQAALALDDATSGKELAFLVLSTLMGGAGAGAQDEYPLSSVPGTTLPPAEIAEAEKADGGGEAKLVEGALARRPETRAAAIGLRASEEAAKAAKADLYPSLSLSGSLDYADPDPRLFPTQDKFNLSWSIGARLRYDLGGAPAALERDKAGEADLARSRADLARSRNAIALDVRKCVLALRRSRDSIELTKGLVAQAEEGKRVADRKFENGLAKRSEVLQAEIALIRSGLAMTGKLVDREIALADLERALGLE